LSAENFLVAFARVVAPAGYGERMSRRRKLRTSIVGFGALIVVLVGTLISAPAASADTVSDAVMGLQSSPPIYTGDPDAVISKNTVSTALPGFARIAIVASGSGSPEGLAQQIGARLDPNGSLGLVVAVVSGNSFGAASSRYCAGYAETKAEQAVSDHSAQLKAGGDHPDLSSLIIDFGSLVATGPEAHSSACGTASGTDTAGKGGSGSSTAWIWLLVIVALLAGGVTALVVRSRRKARRKLADARAQVDPYLDRLANELSTLDAGDNEVARQALADASERYTSAGAQLQNATSIARLVAARQTILQGLYATRTARGALGLDLGPPLPPITDDASQLNEAQPVTVQGQTFQGYPNYSPNAPYYYGGGYGVPGGWYGSPFWETLLFTSVLTGGFGGWGFGGFGGGGYNTGYGTGYDSGYQAGQDSSQGDSGSNWGGGDWGSGGGGGDWGGGGGGGDWGGGGGGGSDGGASW
jgi:hypothetical protein